MRKSLIRLVAIILLLIAALPAWAAEEPSPSPSTGEPVPFFPDLPRPDRTPEPQPTPTATPSLQQEIQIRCFENLSRTQALLEVFALNNEFVYPENLEKLEEWLNGEFSRKTEKHLGIPLDPLTQKSLVYSRSDDGLSYSLSLPDPGKYGLPEFSFANYPWIGTEKIATLKREAEKWRQEKPLVDCEKNLKKIQDALERYYVDNQGIYPVAPEKLTPRYLREIPVCPATGGAYSYQKKRNGKQFDLSCPNPGEHGLQELGISSAGGLIKRK